MNLFRRLLSGSEKHWLLACDIVSLPVEFEVEGVETAAVALGDEDSVRQLDEFAARNGFPVGWARDMLGSGDGALVARDEKSGEVMAMGWTSTQPFYVEEIGATLDPAGSVYLFGDFVALGHRGRRLQRLLVAERLARASVTRACTIIHPGNVASMRSYQSEGFVIAGRFVRHYWLGRTWRRCSVVQNTSRTEFRINETGVVMAQAAEGR